LGSFFISPLNQRFRVVPVILDEPADLKVGWFKLFIKEVSRPLVGFIDLLNILSLLIGLLYYSPQTLISLIS
jgi:hypothetical protein